MTKPEPAAPGAEPEEPLYTITFTTKRTNAQGARTALVQKMKEESFRKRFEEDPAKAVQDERYGVRITVHRGGENRPIKVPPKGVLDLLLEKAPRTLMDPSPMGTCLAWAVSAFSAVDENYGKLSPPASGEPASD